MSAPDTSTIQNGEGVELLPCPFCGNDDPVVYPNDDASRTVRGGCANADCILFDDFPGSYRDRAHFAEWWNTRQSLAREPATADVERVSPRPWRIVPYGDGDSLIIHDARGDYRVCFMATPGKSPDAFDRIKANAEMIVAAVNEYRAAPSSEPAIAPRLVDAVERFLTSLPYQDRHGDMHSESHRDDAFISDVVAFVEGRS